MYTTTGCCNISDSEPCERMDGMMDNSEISNRPTHRIDNRA